MKVLAIDTAGWSCSVALWEDGKELGFLEQKTSRDQAAILPEIVSHVLGDQKPDRIVVNIGPGSFTGIRVGIGFSKGLSMGWCIPLMGMDSFSAHYESLNTNQEDVLVLIEAKRQDIFGKFFKKGIPQEHASFTKEDIKKILFSPKPPVVTGRGFVEFLEGIPFQAEVSATQGAQSLAYTFFKNPSLTSEATPFYAREADVSCPSSSKK